MKSYRNAMCWAAVIIGVAIASVFEVIDKSSATTLLIVLPVAGWMAVTGRGCCFPRKAA